MQNNNAVWMPLYVADYLAETSRLTTEQHGAYLLLMMDYWRNGRLPADDNILANITRLPIERWMLLSGVLKGAFREVDGQLIHDRIERELSKSQDLMLTSIKRSIKGNYVRHGTVDIRVQTNPKLKAWWENEMASSFKESFKDSPKESPKAPQSQSQSHIKEREQFADVQALPDTSQPEKKNKVSKATRLSSDWEPTQEMIDYCRTQRPELDPAVVTENFRDYFLSAPGVKGLKNDWLATWRNWVRRESSPNGSLFARSVHLSSTGSAVEDAL